MAAILSTWTRRLIRAGRRLWVRIALIAALALVAAGVAALVGPFIPEGLRDVVGPEAVDDILRIIASSMLAVTIFSLSVMVSVHRAVSGQWSPRAHRLLVRDPTTMGVLATFVGAWLFALAAIILRSAALIGEGEVVVLFAMTMLVVALIVYTIVRWIAHLERLGSLTQTNERLEREARRALEARMAEPCLGGWPLADPARVPRDAEEVRATRTGWVRHVYEDALQDLAHEHGTEIHLHAPIGRFVHAGDRLAHVGARGEGLHEGVRRHVSIGELRSFEQDPRFGMVVLGEVASKALSPGINDAGTAIDVIGRVARVLEAWRQEAPEGEPRRPRLHVPPLRAADMLEDAFAPVIRDGAGVVEVQIHLRRALAALARHDEPGMGAAARAMAAEARERAVEAMGPHDRARLEAASPSAPGSGRAARSAGRGA